MGGDTLTYTVDDAFLVLGFGKFQALMLAYAGMGWISEAMEVMLLSFVGPAVQLEWGLSSHQESMITSVVFAGMLVGSYSWGIVSDNYGRRNGFLATAFVTGGVGCLSAFAPDYISLVAFRCIVGIGLGGGPVLNSWFLEFVPTQNRGTWMVVFSGFWTLGAILEASLAWIIMPTLGWRWLLALSSIPSIILLLFYSVVPESPRYLCTRGRTADALHILENIAVINKKQLPSGILVSDHIIEHELQTCQTEEAHLLSVTKLEGRDVEEAENQLGAMASLSLLLSQKLIRTTLLIWMVFFAHAFSYYGLVLFTTELSSTNRNCVPNGLHKIESKNNNLYRDVLVTSFAEFPGLLLSMAVVDRVGRKLSMSAMLFMCLFLLIPLIFHQSELLTTCLLFGARLFISGSFTILYIYVPEVYPTSVRTTGFGTASSVGRIGGMLCPLVAVSLLHDCHQILSIVLFEIVIFSSGIAVLLLKQETKGCALNDTI